MFYIKKTAPSPSSDARMRIMICASFLYTFSAADLCDQKRRHLVVLDVDSKDMSVGMSCPPQGFIEQGFLKSVATILHPTGNASIHCDRTADGMLLSSKRASIGFLA